MTDTQNAECLIQAFIDAATAQTELNRAREEFAGTSFDYFGRAQIEEAQNLAQRAADMLAAFIDERIERAKGKS